MEGVNTEALQTTNLKKGERISINWEEHFVDLSCSCPQIVNLLETCKFWHELREILFDKFLQR